MHNTTQFIIDAIEKDPRQYKTWRELRKLLQSKKVSDETAKTFLDTLIEQKVLIAYPYGSGTALSIPQPKEK